MPFTITTLKTSAVITLSFILMIISLNAYGQKKLYGDYRDSLDYVADLSKQHDRIVKYLGELKKKDVLADKEKYRHVFFKDPTVVVPQMVISFDTIKNNAFVKRKKKYTGSKDLLFENKVFNYPVILAGLTFEGQVTFRNCVFMDFILIGGTFKKKVIFERNAFADAFQLGQDKIIARLDSGARFTRNVFLKEAGMRNMESKDIFMLDNNFFDYGLDIKNAIFRQGIWGQHNRFQNELELLNTDCYRDFDLQYSEFLNGLRLSRSNFREVIFSGSKLKKSLPESLYRINQCKISHGLVCIGSQIDSLAIMATNFGKDSSYVDFSRAKIGKLLFLPGARPTLLDLSNAIIDKKGFVDLLKLGDTSRSKLNSGKTDSLFGKKTILYVDNIDLDRIKLDYQSLEIASIAYDPSIHTLTEKLVFDGVDMSGMGSLFGDMQGKVGRSEFDEIVEGANMPPYSDSLWAKKNMGGIAAKEALYKKLMAKFEKENDHRGLEKADVEYRRFLLLERDSTFMNRVSYYADLWWWQFGYARNRVVLWTLFFFALFSLINKPYLKFLVTEIYLVDNIVTAVRALNDRSDPLPAVSHPSADLSGRSIFMRVRSGFRLMVMLSRCRITGFVAYASRHLSLFILSFIYTGFIFFGIKMDADKFVHKKNAGTLWIVLVYTIGLICTAFVINLIIGR